MRKKGIRAGLPVILICLLVAISAASCGKSPQNAGKADPANPPAGDISTLPPEDASPDVSEDAPPEATTPPPAPEPELFEYDGVVEHIFFHEVIAWPELAFDGDSMQSGYNNNMVTVTEFTKILESLHKNDYILVNLNDVWSEYTNKDGERRMMKNTLMLPEDKKPLILSFDDLSFYKYMLKDGFMEKYFIGEDGDIWAIGFDPSGKQVISQDLTVVTILDKFVKAHPDFSLGGAKGCIAFTGYEGILGYRTHIDKKNDTEQSKVNRIQEITRVRPVVKRLKETGWYFATHSYGHIDIASSSLETVKEDANRWIEEVGSLVGETKIFIYPYGSRLDNGDVYETGPALKYYHSLGFRIFASVGPRPFSRIKPDISAVMMDRMNSDGYTLRNPDARERFLRFYDSNDIIDPRRPA